MALEASKLTIEVESRGIQSATDALNKLATAGDKAEKSSAKLSQSSKAAEASAKAQEKVWYDLIAKASAAHEKMWNVQQKAMDRQNKSLENAILKEANAMNAAYDRATKALQQQNQTLDVLRNNARNKAYADVQAEANQMNRLREKQMAQAEADAKRMALLNARFASASSGSRLSTAMQASLFGSAGGNVASQYGSEVAAKANAAGIAQLTAEHKRLQEEANKSRAALNSHSQSMENAHAVARGLSGSLGALWLTYGNVIPLVAGAAIGASIKEAVSGFTEVQYQMTFMKALTEDTTNSVQDLTAAMHKVAGELGINPEAAAKGLRALGQAGLDTKAALETLPISFKLAAVGELPLEAAALAGISVMNAYGKSVRDLEHIGDVMAKAGAMSAASVQSMTESFKYSAGTAEQYGVSLEKLATIVTMLGKRSITGSSAGVATNNLIAEIYSPSSEKAIKAQAALGVKAYTDGVRNNIEDVIQSIKNGLSKYDAESQGILLEAMFGKKGGKAFYAVAMQNKEVFLQMEEEIQKSTGFTANVYRKSLETIRGQFDLTKSAVSNMFSTIGEESEGPIKSLLQTVRQFASSEGVKDAFVGFAQSLKTFLGVATPLVGVLGSVWASLKIGTAAMALFSATNIANVVTGISSAFLKAYSSVLLFGQAIASGNLAMLATNPIMLAIVGAVTLAAGAYLLFKRNKESAMSLHDQEMKNSKEILESQEKEIAMLERKIELQKKGINGSAADSEIRKMGYQDAKDALQKEIDQNEAAKKLVQSRVVGGEAQRAAQMEQVRGFEAAIAAKKKAISQEDDNIARETKNQKRLMEIRETQDLLNRGSDLASEGQGTGPMAEGTQHFDPKAERQASKMLKFYEQERSELEKLRDTYKERTDAVLASAESELRVMAKVQQAKVQDNINNGKYASSAQAASQMALAAEVDRAKFAQQNANGIAEQQNKITEILNRKAAFEREATSEQAIAIGMTERGTEGILKYNHATDEMIAKEKLRARAADEWLRQEEAIQKLRTATSSSTQRAGEAQAEIESMEKFGAKTKVTAIEVAKLTIEKANLSAKGSQIIENNLLEAASLEQLKDSYRNLLKQGIDLNKELQEAQAEGVGTFADSEEAKIQIAAKAAKKRAEIEYNSIVEAANMRINSGTDDGSEWETLFKGYEAYKSNIEKADEVSSQKMANVRIKDWKKSVDDIERIAREGFFNLTASGTNIWSSMLTTFKSMFKTTVMEYIYKEFAKPIVLKLVASVSGAFGFDGLANAASKLAGGSDTASDSLISKATNAFNVFSKGINGISTSIANGVQAALYKTGLSSNIASNGAFATGAGNVATGYGIGSTLNSAISGKYEISNGASSIEKIATAVGSYFSPVIGSVVGAVSGLINRAFGRGPKETTSAGIRGMIGAGGTTGESYTNWKQDGGWFRSDKSGTDKSALGSDFINSFNSGLDALKASSSDFASNLGVSADVLKNYSKTFDITLTKDADANTKAIADFFSSMGDDIATKLVPNIADFGRNGETAAATLERLSSTFKATNDVASLLGKTAEQMFGAAGLASEALRTKLVDLSGGAEALSSKTSAYVDAIYTDAQKLAPVQKAVADAMSALGFAGVTTKDQFKNVVDGLDLTKESNITLLNSLLDLAPAFGAVASAADEAAKTAADKAKADAEASKAISDQAAQQQIDLLDAQGKSSEALALSRVKELAAIDSSLRAVQEQIYAAQDKAKTDELQIALLEAQGKSAEALSLNRAKELLALNETDKAIQQQIYNEQDLAKAKEAALATESLQAKLLEAQGNAAAALVITRRQELAAMSETDQGIQKQIYAMQDAMTNVDSAYSALTKSVNAQKDAIEKAAAAAKEAAQAELDAATDRKKAIEDVISSLDNALKSASTDGDNISAARRAEAQGYLATAAASSRAGNDVTKLAGLSGALDIISKPSTAMFKTLQDYTRDQAKTTNVLETIRNAAQSQADYAQLTIDRLDATIKAIEDKKEADLAYQDSILENAQAQIDALKGINSSVDGLSTALGNFASAVAVAQATITQQTTGNNGNAIEQLYQGLLGRASDAGGKNFFTNAANNGISLPAIADAIKNSKEYQTKIITDMYDKILGRTPDAGGLDFWVNNLQSGKTTLSAVEAAIKGSAESSSKPYIPSLDVGTNSLPADGLIMAHKGERVIPAADNAALMRKLDADSNSAASSSEVAQAISDLKQAMMTGDVEMIKRLTAILKIFNKFDLEGLPETRDYSEVAN